MISYSIMNKAVLLFCIVLLISCNQQEQKVSDVAEQPEKPILARSDKAGIIDFNGLNIQVPIPDNWVEIDTIDQQNLFLFVDTKNVEIVMTATTVAMR